MSSTKTLILLAFLAIAVFANPSLRLKRAPEPQTEAIDGTTAELSPGDDTPAQSEEEASGEAEPEHHEHHEHHDLPEGSGESPVESSSASAVVEAETETSSTSTEEPNAEEPKAEEPKIEETTEAAVLSKEPEADEKPIEAATVVSASEDQPKAEETSSEEPAASSEAPASSATSFVSSLFVLVCVYLIAM